MSIRKNSLQPNLKLVEIQGKDELLTSSLVISEQTDRSHKDVLALIKKFISDMNEVGRVSNCYL